MRFDPLRSGPPSLAEARAVLSGFRVGSVPYLNALPLTAGVEDLIALLPPSELARQLESRELDAALVSTTEVLFSDQLHAVEGFGILSRGPVQSVFLAHRQPLEAIRTIHLDPASCTSVNLLRVLLAERGLNPEFRPLESYDTAATLDNVLLIGNPAIHFRRANPPHQLWDLGEAWQQLTHLPFTYALWAVRSEVDGEPLARALQDVAEFGLHDLKRLVEESPEFDLEFRRAYVGGHIQYPIDAQAKAGLARFAELLERHTQRTVHPLRWLAGRGEALT